jgi:hypothetical protein
MNQVTATMYFHIPWTVYFVGRITMADGVVVREFLLGIFVRKFNPALRCDTWALIG